MCRNIKTLFNFEPPATEDEVKAAAVQFVRKVSGSTTPSAVNSEALELAVEEVTVTVSRLLQSLVTNAPPKNRQEEAAKARSKKRFGAKV
jgi:hypothetical protein